MTNDSRFEALSQYVGSLQQELGGQFTAESVSGWAFGSPDRISFLANTIFGTIRWNKSMGRPATPALADGFVVTHDYQKPNELKSGPGGQVVTPGSTPTITVPLDPPIVFDGNEDDTYYYVGFTGTVDTESDSEAIHVALAPSPWQDVEPFAANRKVQPPDLPAGPREGRPVVLECEVITVPNFSPSAGSTV